MYRCKVCGMVLQTAWEIENGVCCKKCLEEVEEDEE